MKITIRIEIEPLRTGTLVFDEEMEEGSTLKDLLNKLVIKHPEIIKHFYDQKERKLTGAAAIVLNGFLIQILDALETEINNSDVVSVVPIIAGG